MNGVTSGYQIGEVHREVAIEMSAERIAAGPDRGRKR
jgi:hypothetical protein